ncbi:MAG: fibronectin type III domain-containing protein, partial [Candidatus Helarchaeales archaeon]
MKRQKDKVISLFGAIFISLFIFNIATALPISFVAPQDIEMIISSPLEPCTLSVQPDGTISTDGKIELNWTNSNKDVSFYNLYRSNEPGFFPDPSSLLVQELNETGYIDHVSENGIYFYRVTAIDSLGRESFPSNIVEVEVSVPNLIAPQNVKAVALENGKIKVTWDPVEGAQHYEIYRYYTTPNGGRASRAISNIHEPQYIDRSRKIDGIKYEYKIFAYDINNKKSPASQKVFAVADLTPPTGTAILKIEGNSIDRDGNILLTWTLTSAEITSVNIYRSTSSDVPQTGLTLRAENVHSTQYMDINVPDGLHYYKVVPRDEAGNEGIASSIVSVQVNKLESQINILYDPDDPLSVKSAFLLKYLVNDSLPQSVDEYVKLTPISTISELNTFIFSDALALVYSFHGDEEGLVIGKDEISWDLLGDLISKSKVSSHYLASCYSDNLMKKMSSKDILGFSGKVDIKRSAIKIASRIAGLIGDAVDPKAGIAILEEVKNYFLTDPLDIIFRFAVPEEPLWANVSSVDIDPDQPSYDEEVTLFFQINNETTPYNEIYVETNHSGSLVNYTRANYTNFNIVGEDSFEFIIPGLAWNDSSVNYRIFVNGTDGVMNYTDLDSYTIRDLTKPRFFNAGHNIISAAADTLWISVHIDDWSQNASGINVTSVFVNISKNSLPFQQLSPTSVNNDSFLFSYSDVFSSGDNLTWFFIATDNAGNQKIEKHYYYRTSGFYWKTVPVGGATITDTDPPIIISNVTTPAYQGPGTKMNYRIPLDIQVTADDNTTGLSSGIDFVALYGYINGSIPYAVNFTYNLTIQKWVAQSPPLPLGSTFDFLIMAKDGVYLDKNSTWFNFTVADLTPPDIINVQRNPSGPVYYNDSVQVNIQDVIDEYSDIYSVNLSYS